MRLRTDGDFTFFVLQTWTSRSGWFEANLDRYGTPPGFSSNEPCWQRTGHNGTFDREIGLAALTWMSQRHPNDPWRLVSKRIAQETVPIMTYSPPPPPKTTRIVTDCGLVFEGTECVGSNTVATIK